MYFYVFLLFTKNHKSMSKIDCFTTVFLILFGNNQVLRRDSIFERFMGKYLQ